MHNETTTRPESAPARFAHNRTAKVGTAVLAGALTLPLSACSGEAQAPHAHSSHKAPTSKAPSEAHTHKEPKQTIHINVACPADKPMAYIDSTPDASRSKDPMLRLTCFKTLGGATVSPSGIEVVFPGQDEHSVGYGDMNNHYEAKAKIGENPRLKVGPIHQQGPYGTMHMAVTLKEVTHYEQTNQ